MLFWSMKTRSRKFFEQFCDILAFLMIGMIILFTGSLAVTTAAADTTKTVTGPGLKPQSPLTGLATILALKVA